MNRMLSLSLCIVGIVVTQSSIAQVVVVSSKADTGSLTAEQVSSLYLGKTDKFPNGSTALPLDQSAGALRTSFYDKVTGKSEAQVKAAWSRLVFSGKATPPKEVANSAEVKKLVSSNPSTIGYIEKSAVDASVKVVYSAE